MFDLAIKTSKNAKAKDYQMIKLCANHIRNQTQGGEYQYGVEKIPAEAFRPFVEQWGREEVFATV